MIYLDMDGVLVDFVRSALRIHEREDLLDSWPTAEYRMERALGMTIEEFWHPLEELGIPFWANMEPCPWADELVQLVESLGSWIILSSPHDSASAAGKLDWLSSFFGRSFRRYHFTPAEFKAHLAFAPCAVLIDDSSSNCDQFTDYGGRAVLFPRPWNRNHAFSSDPVAFVRKSLLL